MKSKNHNAQAFETR